MQILSIQQVACGYKYTESSQAEKKLLLHTLKTIHRH
jgi:hypothetical protein